MYTLLRLISIFSVLMLVACGGGSSDESQPSPQVPQSTLTTKSQVSLDPTVPTTLSGKITNVISPLSTLSSLNGSIETTDQEALVFALNADDKIVMAGIAVGEKQTVMSADSTALALVRMALTLPESLTEKNFYADVRKAKSFSLLVSAVKSCFDKGLLASEDASVAGLVLAVVDEVGELISSSKSSTSSSVVGVVVSPLPTSPSATSPLPFQVVRNENALGEVTIDSSKRLTNSIPLAWDVTVSNYQGVILPKGEFMLPAAGLSSRLATAARNFGIIGFVLDFFLSEKAVLPDDSGRSVLLEVRQSPRSRLANLTSLYFDVLMEAIGGGDGPDDECRALIANAIFSSDDLSSVASSTNETDYSENIKKMKSNLFDFKITSAPGFISKCTKSGQYNKAVNARYISIYFVRRMNFILNLYDSIQKTYSYASLAERYLLIIKHMNTRKQFTICIGNTGSVANCAVRFEHDPKDFVMVAGDTIVPPLKALDIHNNQTLMSNTIKATGNNSFVTVDEEATIYSALYDGVSEITIKDVATNALPSVLKVEAVQPIFNKDKYSLNVGGGELGSLVDSKGRTIVASSFKSLFDFSSNNSVVDFAINGTLNFLIRANKHGEATIKAKNKITGHESFANVTVSCPAGFDPMADGSCKEKVICPAGQTLQSDGSCGALSNIKVNIRPFVATDFDVTGIRECGDVSLFDQNERQNFTYRKCTNNWRIFVESECVDTEDLCHKFTTGENVIVLRLTTCTNTSPEVIGTFDYALNKYIYTSKSNTTSAEAMLNYQLRPEYLKKNISVTVGGAQNEQLISGEAPPFFYLYNGSFNIGCDYEVYLSGKSISPVLIKSGSVSGGQ